MNPYQQHNGREQLLPGYDGRRAGEPAPGYPGRYPQPMYYVQQPLQQGLQSLQALQGLQAPMGAQPFYAMYGQQMRAPGYGMHDMGRPLPAHTAYPNNKEDVHPKPLYAPAHARVLSGVSTGLPSPQPSEGSGSDPKKLVKKPGRGRPKGSKDGPTVNKEKRGRPKGSKNATKKKTRSSVPERTATPQYAVQLPTPQPSTSHSLPPPQQMHEQRTLDPSLLIDDM